LDLEYEITKKPEFQVLGMVLEDIPFMEGPKRIPQLWPKFISRIDEITQFTVEPYGEFGVMKDFNRETMTFKYLASLPVSSEVKVPEGMEKWAVPAQKYMAVECRLNILMKAVDVLNKSEKYEHSGGVEFEWYPPGYHEAPEEKWMYYYFSVREK
jgi:predicted transcriptional regulator YdeE